MGLSRRDISLVSQFRFRFSTTELNEKQRKDEYLITWIQAQLIPNKAQDRNLDRAEQMMRKSLKWRAELDIDNIDSWEAPRDIQNWVLYDQLGFDYENSTVSYSSALDTKWNEIIAAKQEATFLKYLVQKHEKSLELMEGRLKRNGQPASGVVVIFDMEGMSVFTMLNMKVINLLLDPFRSLDVNHPGTLKACYIINAGKVFSTGFSLFKAKLSVKTISNIQVYGPKTKWRPILKEKIPDYILPPKLR